MAHASVSSCVLAIIASFCGGLDVLKKARERRRKNKRSNVDKISHEESQLVRSLRQGPDEIGRQYHKSVQAAGDRVAVGDGMFFATVNNELLLMIYRRHRADFPRRNLAQAQYWTCQYHQLVYQQ